MTTTESENREEIDDDDVEDRKKRYFEAAAYGKHLKLLTLKYPDLDFVTDPHQTTIPVRGSGRQLEAARDEIEKLKKQIKELEQAKEMAEAVEEDNRRLLLENGALTEVQKELKEARQTISMLEGKLGEMREATKREEETKLQNERLLMETGRLNGIADEAKRVSDQNLAELRTATQKAENLATKLELLSKGEEDTKATLARLSKEAEDFASFKGRFAEVQRQREVDQRTLALQVEAHRALQAALQKLQTERDESLSAIARFQEAKDRIVQLEAISNESDRLRRECQESGASLLERLVEAGTREAGLRSALDTARQEVGHEQARNDMLQQDKMELSRLRNLAGRETSELRREVGVLQERIYHIHQQCQEKDLGATRAKNKATRAWAAATLAEAARDEVVKLRIVAEEERERAVEEKVEAEHKAVAAVAEANAAKMDAGSWRMAKEREEELREAGLEQITTLLADRDAAWKSSERANVERLQELKLNATLTNQRDEARREREEAKAARQNCIVRSLIELDEMALSSPLSHFINVRGLEPPSSQAVDILLHVRDNILTLLILGSHEELLQAHASDVVYLSYHTGGEEHHLGIRERVWRLGTSAQHRQLLNFAVANGLWQETGSIQAAKVRLHLAEIYSVNPMPRLQ